MKDLIIKTHLSEISIPCVYEMVLDSLHDPTKNTKHVSASATSVIMPQLRFESNNDK